MSTWAVPESVWQWKKNTQSLSTILGLLWLSDDKLPQQKQPVFLQHTPAKYYFHVFNGFDIIIKIFPIIRTFAQVFFSTSHLFIFLLDQNARLRNTELCDLCKVMTTHAFLYCCATEGMSLDIYYTTNGIQLLLKCKIMQMLHYWTIRLKQ